MGSLNCLGGCNRGLVKEDKASDSKTECDGKPC